MIEFLLFVVTFYVTLTLWFFLFPIKLVPDAQIKNEIVEPPELFVYSYALHVHSQFSYDSLGKPEDITRARDESKLDFVVVTDHNNDLIKLFADERLIAGKEVKVKDDKGKLAGDLLDLGEVKVIAHHFREKYRWRLERRKDYLLELVDLRDVLLERKLKLSFFLLGALMLFPLSSKRVVRNFVKLVDPLPYVLRYFREGWQNRVVGGHDHHVKIYLREVKKKFLFPDYLHSFTLMRNFLLSRREIKSKEDFLEALGREPSVISFSEKLSLAWTDGKDLMAYSPFYNTFFLVVSEKGESKRFIGSNLLIRDAEKNRYFILGYTYSFRLWKLLFNVKPLFVSGPLEVGVEGDRKAPSRLDKGEDPSKGSE